MICCHDSFSCNLSCSSDYYKYDYGMGRSHTLHGSAAGTLNTAGIQASQTTIFLQCKLKSENSITFGWTQVGEEESSKVQEKNTRFPHPSRAPTPSSYQTYICRGYMTLSAYYHHLLNLRHDTKILINICCMCLFGISR